MEIRHRPLLTAVHVGLPASFSGCARQDLSMAHVCAQLSSTSGSMEEKKVVLVEFLSEGTMYCKRPPGQFWANLKKLVAAVVSALCLLHSIWQHHKESGSLGGQRGK